MKAKSYKVFLAYMSSNIGFAVISLISGYFTYKFLDPELVGLWATVLLIDVYSKFMRFGVLNGLGRELPKLLGQGYVEKAHNFASISLSFNTAINLVLIVFIPLSVWYLDLEITNHYVLIGLVAVVLKILINSVSNVYSLTFRTNSDFGKLAKIKWILGVVKIIGIAPIILFGFYGLVFRDIIIALIELVFLRIWRPFILKFTSNWSGIKDLAKVGVPLFASSYLISIAENIPKLYIARKASAFDLGLVSPVFMILGFIMIIPDAVSSFLYPRMTFRYGQSISGGSRNYFLKVQKLTMLYSFLGGCAIAILVYNFSSFIEKIIPKYNGVKEYIRVFSWCIPFLGWKVNGFILSIFNKKKYIFINSILYIASFSIVFFVIDMLIEEVLLAAIYGLVISMGVMFVVNNLMVRRVIILNANKYDNE